MSPEEQQTILENAKRGQHLGITINVPANRNRTYELELDHLKDLLNHISISADDEKKKYEYNLWRALTGVVVFGSAVSARYHNLLVKKFFGLVRYNERVLIYDKGRPPKDLDVLLIFDDEEIKRQMIPLGPDAPILPLATDIRASYMTSGGYGGWHRATERRSGELDLFFVSEQQLVKRYNEGDSIANHVRDAGTLAIGKCPIDLRSPNFFKATRDELALQFAVV
jgi:hypothetical protein